MPSSLAPAGVVSGCCQGPYPEVYCEEGRGRGEAGATVGPRVGGLAPGHKLGIRKTGAGHDSPVGPRNEAETICSGLRHP